MRQVKFKMSNLTTLYFQPIVIAYCSIFVPFHKCTIFPTRISTHDTASTSTNHFLNMYFKFSYETNICDVISKGFAL